MTEGTRIKEESEMTKGLNLEEAVNNIRHYYLSGGGNPDFFMCFKKKSFEEEIDTEKYNVAGRRDEHYGPVEEVNQIDARFALFMRYRGESIAQATFNIRLNSKGEFVPLWLDSLLVSGVEYPIIKELQGGILGWRLKPFRWEKLLITVIEDWARQSGFEANLVEPYDGPKTVFVDEEEITNPQYMRYNVTPRRMGYKKWNGVWRKNLNQNN